MTTKTNRRRLSNILLVAAFALTACGETDGTEPVDANAQNGANEGKGDEANAETQGIMVEADSVGLGTGAIVELVDVADQKVIVDADCMDGCFHLVDASAGALTDPVTTGEDFGLGTITTVAVARHIENGLLVADDQQVAVVQVTGEGVVLVSTTQIAGATAMLGLASGAYVATDSSIQFGRFEDGALNVLLEESAADESFTDLVTGEARTSTFEPRELSTEGESLWITTADGALWRTDINISAGIIVEAVYGVGEPIVDFDFALEPVAFTSDSVVRLSPGSAEPWTPFEGASFLEASAVDETYLFILDAERGPGLAQISTESGAGGSIDWTYEWTSLASLANYENGEAFVDDEVGISALVVREGVATLLVRP